MIHVIIRARNAEKYIGTCLDTLQKQTQPWQGVLVLDEPKDNTVKVANAYIELKSLPVSVHINKKRMGLGYNINLGMDLIKNPSQEDIVCFVDGDDYINAGAFEEVVNAYKKHNCLLTYGSYIKMSKGCTTRVSKRTIKEPIRKAKWCLSHLKTFKYKLWQHFPEEYLKHEGVWAEAASDRGLMLALAELAGVENCVHIKKAIYVWRDATPYKTNAKLQKKWAKIFADKKPLKRIGL